MVLFIHAVSPGMSKFCIYMHLHHNMCCLAMLRQTSTLCLRLGVHSQPSVKYEEMGDFCEQGKTSLLTTFKQNASRVCMSACVCVCVCASKPDCVCQSKINKKKHFCVLSLFSPTSPFLWVYPLPLSFISRSSFLSLDQV